jgi:hypothetical protein
MPRIENERLESEMRHLFGTTGIEKEATADIQFCKSLIFNLNRLLLEAHSVYFSRSLQFPRLLRR